MTEFDLHKLMTDKIRVTIKWSAFWVGLCFCGSVIFSAFRLGGIWIEQKNRIINAEKTANEALLKSSVNEVKISETDNKIVETDKRVTENSYKIKYLEKVTKN